MTPEDWFVQLDAALPRPGAALPTDALTLSDAEKEALLDLARIAAHTSERWTAPLSTFLAGVAFADRPSRERAAAIRAVATALDPEA